MPDSNLPAAIRQYPAPIPGQEGKAMMSIPTLATYCKYYRLRVKRLVGNTVILEPITEQFTEPTDEGNPNE